LQIAVAKRLQKLQNCKREREREGNVHGHKSNKCFLKKREKKGPYLVSIIKILKMTKVKKKEARLDRGTYIQP
jgi:hypothetical protein